MIAFLASIVAPPQIIPPKINMEPENGPLEKEIPIGCFGGCIYFCSLSFMCFFLVLPGISFWMIFEASHELEGVTSGYFLDGELPQQSSITNVVQYTLIRNNDQTKNSWFWGSLPCETTCCSEGC